MKIVHIEDTFHPEAGYQINIISKYMAAYGHDVTIISSYFEQAPVELTSFFGVENISEKDELYFRMYNVKIVRLNVSGFISGRAVFKKEIFDVVEEEKPDIVFVHGNDTLIGMQFLMKANKLSYPIIMDNHMVEIATRNRFSNIFKKVYKKWFTPIIIKRNIYIIRTQDDPYVNKYYGIPTELSPWISTGSDLRLFHPDEKQKREFRKIHNISENSFVILYAGKLDKAKGGSFLARAIEKKIDGINREIVFIIVGSCNGDEGEKIDECLAKSENTILRFPTQPYAKLEQFYKAADMAVFPRQCSLSFYDVQAAGLPVLFDDEPVNMTRTIEGGAITFHLEDTEDFRKQLKNMITMSKKDFELLRDKGIKNIQQKYNYEDITNDFIVYMNRAIKIFKDNI